MHLNLNTDQAIRAATGLTVTAVSAFAGIVSYEHIHYVAEHHHQSVLDSALLPLSIDGLVLASSMVMLYASRNPKLTVPVRAYVMLAFSMLATIGGNLIYGIQFGWLSALISALPAVSFIGSIELLMWTVRMTADKPWERTSRENAKVKPKTAVRMPRTASGEEFTLEYTGSVNGNSDHTRNSRLSCLPLPSLTETLSCSWASTISHADLG